jgi:hypothetical protein
MGHLLRLLLRWFQFVLVSDVHAHSLTRLENEPIFSKQSLTVGVINPVGNSSQPQKLARVAGGSFPLPSHIAKPRFMGWAFLPLIGKFRSDISNQRRKNSSNSFPG